MGKYTIEIHGEGQHDSAEEHHRDANVVAADVVRYLKDAGHKISSALFHSHPADVHHGITTTDLHLATEPSEATEAEKPGESDQGEGVKLDPNAGQGAPAGGPIVDPNAPPLPVRK